MSQIFDFDKALRNLQAGKNLTGKDGVLMSLTRQLTEAAITVELDHHLASSDEPNRKNGTGSKTVKSGSGSFEGAGQILNIEFKHYSSFNQAIKFYDNSHFKTWPLANFAKYAKR